MENKTNAPMQNKSVSKEQAKHHIFSLDLTYSSVVSVVDSCFICSIILQGSEWNAGNLVELEQNG